MLFRITISAVNMLINPDEISDKNAGGSKLITNIIVTIMLLFYYNQEDLYIRN